MTTHGVPAPGPSACAGGGRASQPGDGDGDGGQGTREREISTPSTLGARRSRVGSGETLASSEGQRLGRQADRLGAGGGEPATVVLAAEHLVGDLGRRPPRSSTSPTTMTSPSVTIIPSSVRALWVARLPHQHSASTWSTLTRSASSTSRAGPGKLGPEVGEDAEAKTSICSSSTILASWSIWSRV